MNKGLINRIKVTIRRLVVNIFDRVINNLGMDKKSTKSINIFTTDGVSPKERGFWKWEK